MSWSLLLGTTVMLIFGLTSCKQRADAARVDTVDTSAEPVVFRTGAEALANQQFEQLKGLRIGLITNHTARLGSDHLVDVLIEHPNVDLVALFGPEHGLKGNAAAGVMVEEEEHPSGVPVYSLYHYDTRRPDPEHLKNVDALVFDIQDVGARFYTYISTMGETMMAAADAGLPFIILDRPNPLGGNLVSGFVTDESLRSFVGFYPIPILHGMTMGELAKMVKGEGYLDGLENLDLRIVPMEGWNRDTRWPELDREWVPTSPNIPDFETALIYAGMCLIEGSTFSEGRGTPEPFKLVGGLHVDADSLALALNNLDLPGVRFDSASFVPEDIPGVALDVKLRSLDVSGVRITVTNPSTYRPLITGVHVLKTLFDLDGHDPASINAPWLSKLAGSEKMAPMLVSGDSVEEIEAAWQADVDQFKLARSKYLSYLD